jgi:predicted permease
MSSLRRLFHRVKAGFGARRAEADLAREIQAHLQLLEDTFAADGMSAAEARQAARRAFGGVELTKEQQRDVRSFRVIDYWKLDFILGLRILRKYPGLTLVGGLGMAVAVALAATAFSIGHTLLDPDLPINEGDRIVALQNWDLDRSVPDRRAVGDFEIWRRELRNVEDVGAFRTLSRNLIIQGRPPELVSVAEMTASGFRIARVPPLLGRPLVEDDEREGSPPVLVIGYEIWRTRFAADNNAIGQIVQLGDAQRAIVGVMPEGFAFPVNDNFWIPFRNRAFIAGQSGGPEVFVFGRLAPDTTQETAQAELTAIGQRTASAYPATHERLRPQVLSYAAPFSDMDQPENVMSLRLVQLILTFLLVIVSANVAILVYARTATRQAEIAVRGALGADRRRIVAQLFIEALVLSAAAAGAGLALSAFVLDQLNAALSQVAGQLPIWMVFGLSGSTILYVCGLAVIGACVVGIVPALKSTAKGLEPGLRIISIGGSGVRLGGTWTTLVVAQVAFAVALLPAIVYQAWQSTRQGLADAGPVVSEFLTARLATESRDRFGQDHAELMRRLEIEPAVAGVTFSMRLPGQEPIVWVEADGVATPPQSEAEYSNSAVRAGVFGHEVRVNRVGVNFLDAFGVRLLTGRSFTNGDGDPSASTVLVNGSLAGAIFKSDEVLGRRIRYVGRSGDAGPEAVELGRWYEIVGVVDDFPRSSRTDLGVVPARIYHAAAPGQVYPVTIAVRTRGPSAATLAGRLREVGAAVDPNLQVVDVSSMDEVLRREQRLYRLIAATLALVTLAVVLLSSAGIYALMSFTVAQRRREIGLRAALGADPRRIVAGIFSRATAQLAAGALLGVLAAISVERITNGDLMEGHGAVLIPLVSVFMTLVGLLATLGPARRGLRIPPMEALRES